MVKTARSYAAWFGFGVVLACAAAVVLVPGLVSALFSSGSFMPHAHCYLNDPRMLMLQGLSDGFIGVAYMAISVALGYMVYVARKDIPFEWMFIAFGLFIFSCGWTHFLEVWTLWHPTYWLSGAVKGITAVASVATAIGVPLLLPKVFGLIETAKASESRKQQLEKAHEELESLNRRLRDLDELKSQFFANVSHELRTPLAIIMGSLERMEDAANLEPEQRQSIRSAQRNSRDLLKHVNDLLDASKLEAGKMDINYHRFDLAELVRLVASNFQSMAQDQCLRFHVSTPESLIVEADAEKIERVLTNLLSNAFKFTPGNNDGIIRCEVIQDGEGCVLKVADNGPGIPAEKREVIFERFRQLDGGAGRRFGGTGLGLSITRDFVELHKGSVKVDTSPEGGALFSVRLPAKAPVGIAVKNEVQVMVPPQTAHASSAVLEPRAIPNARPDAPTVLVVEDNPEMNDLICRSLAPDYRPIPVLNGEAGVAKAKTERLDLVLTDMMMPGMGGQEFVSVVRSDPSLNNVPIIILTAKADELSRINMLRHGAQDFLLKPFTREELQARAGNLVKAKQFREQLERANQELEAFSYSLAHDLRGPLRSIKMFAHLLREDHASKLAPEALDYLSKISTSGDRLERMISDVLGYTRMARNPLELHPIDTERLIKDIIKETADFQPPKARVEIESPLPRVLGDLTSLTQIATNLLSNAVKYVAPGVTPHVRISGHAGEAFTRILFKDNGIGIDSRNHERIFGLFQRLHSREEYEGTGLGLSIVRKAVERMDGRIGVDSAPGQGSVFWIELRRVFD